MWYIMYIYIYMFIDSNVNSCPTSVKVLPYQVLFVVDFCGPHGWLRIQPGDVCVILRSAYR